MTDDTKQRLTISVTPELYRELMQIPEGLRSMQIEMLLRPQVGLMPLVRQYQEPEQLTGCDEE